MSKSESTQRKARIVHVCDVCSCRIPKGMEYISVRHVDDNEKAWYLKCHIHCHALFEEYNRRNGGNKAAKDIYDAIKKTANVSEWIIHEVCGECDNAGLCTRFGKKVCGCANAAKELLPVNVRNAAVEASRIMSEWEGWA